MFTDGRTEGWTDGWTEKSSHRVACPQLKRSPSDKPNVGQTNQPTDLATYRVAYLRLETYLQYHVMMLTNSAKKAHLHVEQGWMTAKQSRMVGQEQ